MTCPKGVFNAFLSSKIWNPWGVFSTSVDFQNRFSLVGSATWVVNLRRVSICKKMSAIDAYRQLLRATRKTFVNDTFKLRKAQEMIRLKFDENRDETNPLKIKKLVQVAIQAEVIVRKNVVQAIHRPNSNVLGTFLFTLELQLTPDKEINDNDSISSGCGQPAGVKDKGTKVRCPG